MVNNPANWQALTPSVANTLRVSQPAAGATIVSLGSLPPGIYAVMAMASYGGTPDVIDNMALFVGDRKITDLPVIPVANSSPIPVPIPALLILGVGELAIKANAAGAVGAVYRGTLIATPVQSMDPT